MQDEDEYTIRLIYPGGFFIVTTKGEKIPYFQSTGFKDSGKTTWDLGVEEFTDTEKLLFKALFGFIDCHTLYRSSTPREARKPLSYYEFMESFSDINLIRCYHFLLSNSSEQVKNTLEYIFCIDLNSFSKDMEDIKEKHLTDQ